jgi:hypothetical protein
MLSGKTKGLFVEKSRFRTKVVLTSSMQPPYVVEQLVEFPADAAPEKLREELVKLSGLKNPKYVQGVASVYPQGRYFQRHSVETPIKLKEPGYFEEVVKGLSGVDMAADALTFINACDGTAFDPERPLVAQKELIVCGAPLVRLKEAQDALLAGGLFPTRMELGSVSCMGAVSSLARLAGMKKPVLLLEIGQAMTHAFIVGAERVDLCRSIPHGLDSMLPVIASELGVKDEQSARNILYSNTFDLAEMGPVLLARLLREIKATTGFYEVQTGQSIGALVAHLLPASSGWVRQCVAKALGVEPLRVDLRAWLQSANVQLAPGVALDASDQCWIGPLGLLVDHAAMAEAQAAGGGR